MQVKIKKIHPNAVVPSYAKVGDAGLDLTCVSMESNEMYIEYDTGLAVELEDGYVGLVFPRSSISKYHLNLANSVGVVDSGYRGSIKLRFKKTLDKSWENLYNVGDKVGQLIIMPFPKVELVEVAELSDSVRGSGGFGSTGV